jgi:hypothetical protein
MDFHQRRCPVLRISDIATFLLIRSCNLFVALVLTNIHATPINIIIYARRGPGLRREFSKHTPQKCQFSEASREGLHTAVVVANLGALFTAELVRVAMRLPLHWNQTDPFTFDRNLLPV